MMSVRFEIYHPVKSYVNRCQTHSTCVFFANKINHFTYLHFKIVKFLFCEQLKKHFFK